MDPSVPLHGRTQLGDVFNEDVSELKFLKSKPTCFVLFGKPGCGKTSIAKKLSEIWKCELIHGTDIVQREIDINSPVGNKMQEMLMKGEALPTEFIIQLIKEKLSSPEVAHYGYVLDGLPSLSDQPDSAEHQLDIIKSCQLKPDFIINIKIPDVDLISRKNGIRVDSLTGDNYLRSVWDPPPIPEQVKVMGGEEEEGGEEMEEGEEEEIEENKVLELAMETKERLIQIPEHQKEQVTEINQHYKDVLLKLIEEYIADHDRQYFIELDGNTALPNMMVQLMNKLETYTARRAVVPIRLQSTEEEELPDEIDTDELLRTLASYQMPGPRHRWRRSKWGRWCPVALKKGNMVQGKPDLAVGFLDKIYVMSSPEAMGEFLKNPRRFLLPPLPVAPCKLAVFGPPLSGKTTVCKLLSESYQATVLDMKVLMKKKLADARQDAIDKARQEATEQSVAMVQNKLEHEALERAEKRKKEAQEEADKGAEEDPDAKTAEEEPTDDVAESLPVDEESVIESETSSVPTVTAAHEEVQRMVQEAVSKAEKLEIKLPPEDYVEVLKEAMKKMVEERLAKDEDAPKDGGWILDGFPENKDQWSVMVDAGIVPDECVVMVDKSPNQEFIRKRYFEAHRSEITDVYRSRLIAEKQTSLKEVEEDLKRAAVTSEITDDTDITEDTDKDAKSEVVSEASQPVSVKGKDDDIKRNQLIEEISQLQTRELGVPPHDSPELAQFREELRAFDKEWTHLHGNITGSGSNKPIQSEVNESSPEVITDTIAKQIEGSFGYRPWSFTGVDLDEDEEDAGADDDQEEEGEDEASKNKKKMFGYSKHFDPVALKEEFVLCPGNSEIAAKYRERVYFFKSTDNREKFLENPVMYLPKNEPLKPPPPRILILGARGSGKSLQGRILADKIGVFHISFRDRLQEMILPKTKRRVGWEYEEEKLLVKEKSVSIDEAVKKAIEASDETANDEDEEEKYDLTDEEEAIRANLVDDEPLPVEVLEKIVPTWWRKEPYKSAGFVLEGFPRTVEECQFLLQSGLFPDVALLLMVDDNDVIKRLLPPRMKLWKTRREIKDEKKLRIKEKKKEIRNEKIEARRIELMNEQKEKKAAQTEDEEDEEEEDIEELLMAEFEEEEGEEEEEELEQDASDRMRAEFGEHFDDDVNKLQVVQEQLEEGLITRVEIQASRKASIVTYLINAKLTSVVQQRCSIFERPYPVSEAMAGKLLLSGFKHPSSFSKWDPVKLYDGDVIQPMQGSISYPVVYNQFVYFMSSLETRNRFMENPTEFVFKKTVAKPVVPIQVAVLGPPKSGKTTLCERFSQKFGTIRVSVGECVRKILETQPESHLASQILSFLHQGQLLPDELAVEALSVILLDTTCTTRGYALDGFPATEEQMLLMGRRGILPIKMIELQLDDDEILHRASNDQSQLEMIEQPFHKSDDVLMVKSSSYHLHIGKIRKNYEEQHQNWFSLKAKVSKWKLWKTVLEVATSSVGRVQDYLDRIARGEAACLANLCISPSEFESHLGAYSHYCPVSLNKRGELVDCSDPCFLQFAVEYRSKYYKTSSKDDMAQFIASPDKFVPPDAPHPLPPPHMLPKRRSKEEVKLLFPMQVDLNGYCPVSYFDGKLRFESLVEGSMDMAVEYCQRLYLMSSEERLDKFMRTPQVYSGLKLPEKLPPKKEPFQLTGLPMLGYLEQGASTAIIRALTAVGCFKPKFPFSSIQRSSIFYIACHLKGFNPRSPDFVRKKYQKKLKEFEDTCQVITYLGNHMPSRYPPSLPVDFDTKMKLFLGLENNRPTRNRVR